MNNKKNNKSRFKIKCNY